MMLKTLHLACSAVVLVCVLAALSSSAQSATIVTYTTGQDGGVVLLSGEITTGDAGRLTKLVETAVKSGRPSPSVSLNSPGGLFWEGIQLAQAIRRLELTTYVEEGAVCASACFLVFAAGKERLASYSSRIGVHSAKAVSGDANQATAATQAMGLLLKALNVSPAIIDRMAATPHERVAWLSTAELHSIGVKPLRSSDESPLDRVLPQVAEQGLPSSIAEPEKVWLWSRLIRAATRLSAEQNEGRARITNACAPGSHPCANSVSYNSKSGSPITIRTVRDRSGTVETREVCAGRASEAQLCRPWVSRD